MIRNWKCCGHQTRNVKNYTGIKLRSWHKLRSKLKKFKFHLHQYKWVYSSTHSAFPRVLRLTCQAIHLDEAAQVYCSRYFFLTPPPSYHLSFSQSALIFELPFFSQRILSFCICLHFSQLPVSVCITSSNPLAPKPSSLWFLWTHLRDRSSSRYLGCAFYH